MKNVAHPSGAADATRFPLADLVEAMGMSQTKAARVLKLSGRSLVEYRDNGMSPVVADRMAVRAGFHPSSVWPDWWDACDIKDDLYKPGEKGDVDYKDRARKKAERERLRYYLTPGLRARKAEARKAYYEAHAEAERAEYRRYYALHAERERERRRDYYRRNRERVKARQRAYRARVRGNPTTPVSYNEDMETAA